MQLAVTTKTPFAIVRRFSAGFRTTRAENPPSGTKISRRDLFDFKSPLGSWWHQLPTHFCNNIKKIPPIESFVQKVSILTLTDFSLGPWSCEKSARDRERSQYCIYNIIIYIYLLYYEREREI